MSFTARLGRSLLAPMFVTGGLDAMRHPESKAVKAEEVTGPVASTLGLPDDPAALVRFNGGVQVIGGLLLAAGVFYRLAAFGLAASLVPTTLAGHRFWDEADPAKRSMQRIQFLKNTAMLGGLIVVAADSRDS